MVVTSSDEAIESDTQPTKPCHDCPWRRNATPGWLGTLSASDWIDAAHGDGIIDCHTLKGTPQPQCAGAAIYRANNCKNPRDPRAIRLSQNKELVFKNRVEFAEHHARKK